VELCFAGGVWVVFERWRFEHATQNATQGLQSAMLATQSAITQMKNTQSLKARFPMGEATRDDDRRREATSRPTPTGTLRYAFGKKEVKPVQQQRHPRACCCS